MHNNPVVDTCKGSKFTSIFVIPQVSVERGNGMQESLTAAIFRGVVVPATALAKARAG